MAGSASPALPFEALLSLAAELRRAGAREARVAFGAMEDRLPGRVSLVSETSDPHLAQTGRLADLIRKVAGDGLKRCIAPGEIGRLQAATVAISAEAGIAVLARGPEGNFLQASVDISGMRSAALAHPVMRARCLAAALSDEPGCPPFGRTARAEATWLAAAEAIDPRAGAGQPGLREAAGRVRRDFGLRGAGSSIEEMSARIGQRLFAAPSEPEMTMRTGAGLRIEIEPLHAEMLQQRLEMSRDPLLQEFADRLRGEMERASRPDRDPSDEPAP